MKLGDEIEHYVFGAMKGRELNTKGQVRIDTFNGFEEFVYRVSLDGGH
jgi:hypothetical protein